MAEFTRTYGKETQAVMRIRDGRGTPPNEVDKKDYNLVFIEFPMLANLALFLWELNRNQISLSFKDEEERIRELAFLLSIRFQNSQEYGLKVYGHEPPMKAGGGNQVIN